MKRFATFTPMVFSCNATFTVGEFDATTEQVEKMIEDAFNEAAPSPWAMQAESPLARHEADRL